MRRLRARAWIEQNGSPLLGEESARLLSKIESSGSLSQAALRAGLSYRHAWGLLQEAERVAGGALVARTRGGSGGGGTRLTPEGRRILADFEHRSRALLRVADEETFWEALGVKLSARNRLAGVVRSVETDGVAARVEIDLGPRQRVVSFITKEAAEHLELKPGTGVAAVIKATEVMVMTRADAPRAKGAHPRRQRV